MKHKNKKDIQSKGKAKKKKRLPIGRHALKMYIRSMDFSVLKV